jgi:hypothetical protein
MNKAMLQGHILDQYEYVAGLGTNIYLYMFTHVYSLKKLSMWLLV